MIKIIKDEPDPSVVKNVICKRCGRKLEYTPSDVQHTTGFVMDELEITRWIACPKCSNTVIL
mgnify:CR=1 FL=1